MKKHNRLSNILFKLMFISNIIIFCLLINTKSVVGQSNTAKNLKTLEQVFRYIENNSKYSVFYKNDKIDIKKNVSINTAKKSINEILNLALKTTDLTYKYVGNQIVIYSKTNNKKYSDDFIIKGTITDDKGETIPGVNIIIKGTTNGTTSDINGNYTIKVNNLNQTLIFSFIGFKTIMEPIKGRTTINIVMHISAISLNQVVVVGYGTKKKADIIGSVSVIKPNEISRLPVSTISQALQGKATGVKVTQSTGAPGEGVSVRIRGIGTINNNSPLYIIDGIPTKDAFVSLSPSDIQSISILKDASAAAIYGSRAANGVVLITTKKGGGQASHINYSTYTGVQMATHLTKMCNKDQYIEIYNEAANADGRMTIPQSMADTLPNTNWWDEIFRPAIITNHNLTVNGGDKKLNYIVSGTYFKQDGIILNSDYTKYAIRSSINSELTNKISTGININLSNSITNKVGSSGDGYMGNGGSVVRYAFFRTPIYPVYDKNGDYIDYYHDYANIFGDGYNPVGFADKYDWKTKANRFFGNVFVKYKIIEDLTFKSDFGIDYNIIGDKRFNENWGYKGRINKPNSLEQSTIFDNTNTWKNTLTYNKKISEFHNLNILLGSELIKNTNYGQIGSAQNFPDQISNLRYLRNGTKNEKVDGWKEGWALFSMFGRVSYKYKNKYLAEVVLRRDGSSRFGSNNPYGFFPAASLGWRIDEENFMKNVKNISHFKLRLSAGKLGNQEIGNYSFASLITSGVYYPFGTTPLSGYFLSQHGNENLKWESQTQYDAGIDIGLFNNKIFCSLDYYNKLTDNMLVKAPLPPSSGSARAPFFNAGKVENKGIELEINYKNNIKNLKYNIGLVLSHYSNEVTELYGHKPIPAGRIDNGFYSTLTEEGYPIGSFYLYEMEGIFQDTAEIISHAFQGTNIHPGDVKYKDISGPDSIPDGIIDSYDRTHVGSSIPDFTYGLNMSFKYKNWDFSFFIEGVQGNKVYWQAAHDIEGFYRAFNITERVYDGRWTGPGTSNYQPRVSWSGATNNKKPSTRFLFDASYLRLKNINIAYTFNKNFVDKIGVKSLTVYVSSQNLLTITKYPGLDPEMQTSDNAKTEGDLAVGIDWGTYPSAAVYNIGLNIGF